MAREACRGFALYGGGDRTDQFETRFFGSICIMVLEASLTNVSVSLERCLCCA